MIAQLPLAEPTTDELVVSRMEHLGRIKRYSTVRAKLLPEQAEHYDRKIKQMTQHEFPPEIMAWGRYFFPHYFTKPSSLMHHKMAADLQWMHKQRGTKRAKIAPRSGAKTTWTSKLYTLYCVCLEIENYILLIGDTSDQSWQNLAAVKKELTENDALAQAYPQACGEGARWNESYIITKNGIKVEALGARKKVRGRNHGAYRPGLVIIDDLDNDDAVMSEYQREKIWRWFTKALMPIGTSETNFLFVGTALHHDDVIHRLKAAPPWQVETFKGLMVEPTRADLWQQWKSIFCNFDIPVAIREVQAREFYEAHPEMNDGAKLLWPEHESLYFYMERRASYGEAAFQSEYQGVPSADKRSEWPSECFADNMLFDRWPPCVIKVLALDPSKGKTDTSDYSAYVTVGLSYDGILYVEADVERRDATRIIDDGFELYNQHQPADLVVEINQFQELLKDEFERQATERGVLLPITGVTNTIKKTTRIRTIGPYLRQGKMRFKSGSEGTRTLLKQLREFPYSQYDDGPDALQMAVKDIERLLAPPVE